MTRLRYITIFRHPSSRAHYIQIIVPRDHRAAFLKSPLASRLGFKPDKLGRVRKSMGRLKLADIQATAQRWERLIDAAILHELNADFERVLREIRKK